MTNERDDELDRLLEPLRQVTPESRQIAAWQAAVRHSRATVRRVARSRWVQLAAAAGLGFALGGLYFNRNAEPVRYSNNEFVQEETGDATVVYLYAKSE